MKIIGYILLIGGIIATFYSIVNYLNESESFTAFGLDIAISSGNPLTIVVSVIILLAGIFIIRASKK